MPTVREFQAGEVEVRRRWDDPIGLRLDSASSRMAAWARGTVGLVALRSLSPSTVWECAIGRLRAWGMGARRRRAVPALAAPNLLARRAMGGWMGQWVSRPVGQCRTARRASDAGAFGWPCLRPRCRHRHIVMAR